MPAKLYFGMNLVQSSGAKKSGASCCKNVGVQPVGVTTKAVFELAG